MSEPGFVRFIGLEETERENKRLLENRLSMNFINHNTN